MDTEDRTVDYFNMWGVDTGSRQVQTGGSIDRPGEDSTKYTGNDGYGGLSTKSAILRGSYATIDEIVQADITTYNASAKRSRASHIAEAELYLKRLLPDGNEEVVDDMPLAQGKVKNVKDALSGIEESRMVIGAAYMYYDSIADTLTYVPYYQISDLQILPYFRNNLLLTSGNYDEDYLRYVGYVQQNYKPKRENKTG